MMAAPRTHRLGSLDDPDPDIAGIAACYGMDPDDVARGVTVLRPGGEMEGVVVDVTSVMHYRGRFPALVIDRGGSRVILSAEHKDLRSELLMKAMLLDPKDRPLARDEDIYRFLVGHRIRVRNLGRSDADRWRKNEYRYEVILQ
jgi:hypothetical protein